MELTDGVRSIRLSRAEAHQVVVEIFKTRVTDLYLLGDILYTSYLSRLILHEWQFTFILSCLSTSALPSNNFIKNSMTVM